MNDQLTCSLEIKNSPRNIVKWEGSPPKCQKDKQKHLEALRGLFTSIEMRDSNDDNFRFTRSNTSFARQMELLLPRDTILDISWLKSKIPKQGNQLELLKASSMFLQHLKSQKSSNDDLSIQQMLNELCISNDLVLNLRVIKKQIEERITSRFKQELLSKIIEVVEFFNNHLRQSEQQKESN